MSGDDGEAVLEFLCHVGQCRVRRAGVPIREGSYARDRHVSTGVKRRRQAASGAIVMAGAWRVGYGYQSAALAAMKAMTAADDVATRIQSVLRICVALSEVRGPEPKPRASIDSASWIDPSTLVSTTGTTTSAQERGPLGRQPRSRCASLTWTKDEATEGTRLSEAAIAAPVRERAEGSASITSCEASIKEKGAAAAMAAETVMPPLTPAARGRGRVRSFCLLRLGRGGGRGRGLVGDVAPPQRVLVVKHHFRVCITGWGHGPGPAGLDEHGPVGSARGKAFVVLRGLVVDRADGLAEAEGLGLKSDAGLVHQRLTVDSVAGKADALLQRGARAVLDHDVCAMQGACVDT